MMCKDPSKRITLEQLAREKWFNEGFSSPLEEDMQVNKLEEVTDQEIDNAMSISTIIKIKHWIDRHRIKVKSGPGTH